MEKWVTEYGKKQADWFQFKKKAQEETWICENQIMCSVSAW